MLTFAFTILAAFPLLVWTFLVGWSPDRTEGKELLSVPLPLLSRLKMLGTSWALSMVVAIVGGIVDAIPWWITLVVIFIYAALLAMPVSYTLTTMGIRTGHGVFRRWTEFAGVRRSPSGVTLQGGPRSSSYPIFLSGSREDDQFVHTLRTLVRDSYKGKTRNEHGYSLNDGQAEGETSTTSSISH